MSEVLLIERRGAALWLTLNRPEAHNAINRALTDALVDAFELAASDELVRVVVLTAGGDKTFCAGADLKDAAGASTFSAAGGENPLVRVFRAMRACRKPIVGRIVGSALGGGLGLVAACDLAYCADDVRFGTPEVKVGVFPMMISAYLMRQLPRRRYWEMAFLGDPLTAAEAQQCGLVNRAIPRADLDAQLGVVVDKLLRNAPTALRMGKQALDVMQDMSFDQTLVYADLMIEKLAATEEAREGRAAFAEKRAPRWAEGVAQ
ncbi:enoyl-CoA hydratase-related protein [Azoarcus sp. KH32C]|uniref:enoyl-CoA hydratase-related protein n=1 Tax=Azoarcus sp. KH32C TaxID=748247 RepID=UPI0002386964|nr:enoyl-CoA hydratase-related protein [Azoarcus sp. KH32C]BAL24815.1 enoyl-CoA hydratase [Azoarcus sp. KH32C]